MILSKVLKNDTKSTNLFHPLSISRFLILSQVYSKNRAKLFSQSL